MDFSKNFFATSAEPVSIASFASNLITALISFLMMNEPDRTVPVLAAISRPVLGNVKSTLASVAHLRIAWTSGLIIVNPALTVVIRSVDKNA